MQEIYEAIAQLSSYIEDGERPTDISTENDQDFTIEYATDEDGDHYATILYDLPEGVYAEIDSKTYGNLYGFRVYLPLDK